MTKVYAFIVGHEFKYREWRPCVSVVQIGCKLFIYLTDLLHYFNAFPHVSFSLFKIRKYRDKNWCNALNGIIWLMKFDSRKSLFTKGNTYSPITFSGQTFPLYWPNYHSLMSANKWNWDHELVGRPICPLRSWAYWPTAGISSTYLQKEVKDHSASLGANSGQHVEFSSRCWVSRLELPLQIDSYPDSLRYRSALPGIKPKKLALYMRHNLWVFFRNKLY